MDLKGHSHLKLGVNDRGVDATQAQHPSSTYWELNLVILLITIVIRVPVP